MRKIPLEVLLSFPIPNYRDPETQGESLVIINGVFAGLVVIVVAARMYTRLYIKRWFGMDDFFILLAMIFTVGLNVAVILANQRYYWDRHIWDIPIREIERESAPLPPSQKNVRTKSRPFKEVGWSHQMSHTKDHTFVPLRP